MRHRSLPKLLKLQPCTDLKFQDFYTSDYKSLSQIFMCIHHLKFDLVKIIYMQFLSALKRKINVFNCLWLYFIKTYAYYVSILCLANCSFTYRLLF